MKIFLADDHPIVRQGMKSLIESVPDWVVVGEASDGLIAIDLIGDLQPDVAIVDVMMPSLSGLEVIRRATKCAPRSKLIALSMHADEAYVVDALRGGAKGYVLKATSTRHLMTAVSEVIAGNYYLSPPLTRRRVDEYLQRASDARKPIDRYELLTTREREVLHLVANGETNVRIGERLAISPRTVESHRANLMKKLGLQSSSDLHHYAFMRGIRGPG